MKKILCTTSTFGVKNFPSDYEIIMNPFKRKLSEEEVLKLIRDHNPEGIIAGVEPLTRKVLESATNLKVISRCGVGLDSVDLEAATERKIKVFNTPDAPVKPVAELTVGMIYNLIRGIDKLNRNTKEGKWIVHTGGLVGEKMIGIIGCGRIGTRVAELLSPTGAEILGYDPAVMEHPVCRMVPFDYLIANADIITLHIPLTKENINLLSGEVLEKTKPGTIIINNSRGDLLDEQTLNELLQSGHLAGAGLDVFRTEPYTGPLCNQENVILTPHIGSSAGNARMEMENAAVRNLISGLKE
jgi:D-3-phosphoglycerate dehydrogenase